MKSIFLLQWQRFRRSPFLVLSMTVLSIVFALFIAGFSSNSEITLYAYTDPAMKEEQKGTLLAALNNNDAYQFELKEEAEVRQAVTVGEVTMAVQLMGDDYRILAAADDFNRPVVEQHVKRVYMEELRLREAERLGGGIGGTDVRAEVGRSLAEPALRVTTSTPSAGDGEISFAYDSQLQGLFGMTLFFAIYTIMFSLTRVSEEKGTGTWDRLIISPLRKWQMYVGHLVYCFMIGYAQIVLIFLLFQYVFGFDIGDRFGTIMIVTGCYVFSIVALGMLLIGLVRSTEQLYSVVPIVAVSMAMLGGAYWPIEAVSNQVILTIAKGIPITYGMEALIGAAQNMSILDLAEPLSIMLLIGVLCMGVGINLMERRNV
jgi:ABC-2 type transport system permease protein